MQYQALLCPLCLSEFNNSSHLPRIIPSCGHTLCTRCLTVLLQADVAIKCPFDNQPLSSKKKIDSYHVNSTVKHLIEEIYSDNMCQTHDEKLRLFCFTDKKRICDDCALFGDHKGHDIKPLKQIQPDIDTKRKKLESALDNLDKQYHDIDSALVAAQTGIVKGVKDSFEELRKLVSWKESETLCEINGLFDTLKTKVENLYGPLSKGRSHLAANISHYRSFPNCSEILRLIEDDVTPLIAKFEPEILEDNVQKIRTNLSKATDSLVQELHEQTAVISQIQVPIERLQDISAALLGTPSQSGSPTQVEGYVPFRSQTMFEFGKYQDYLKISTQAQDKSSLVHIKDAREIQKARIMIDRYSFTDEDINTLFHVWRSVENVSCLELVCNPKDVSDHALLRLFPAIFWKTKELSDIKLHLNNCKVGDESIIFLMEKILPKLTSIQKLDLNFCNTDITDLSIHALVKYNDAMIKGLESFRLGLRDTKVTDESVSKIFCAQPKLKNFALDLNNTKTSDRSLEAFCKNGLTHMKGLESFSLCVSSTKVTDQSVTKVFTLIPNVKEMILDFSSTKVTDNLVKTLVKNKLTCLKQLTNFEIHLDTTPITDDSLLNLAVSMEKVKRLALYLDSTEISDKGLDVFAKKALSPLKELEVLEMYLSDTKLTDQGAMQILNSNLNKLKELILDFSNTRITNKTLHTLGTNLLPNMKELENLELVVYDTAVTDKGVACMCVPMEKLKKFILHLDSTEVTDKSLETLAKNLVPTMKALETFELHLNDTECGDEGVIELLNSFQNVKKIILDLDSTSVTDEVGEIFINTVVPKLKELKEFEIDLSNTDVTNEMLIQMQNLKTGLLKKKQGDM